MNGTLLEKLSRKIIFKMVNESVNIKDKYRILKKIVKILIIFFSVCLVLIIVFAIGFLLNKPAQVIITLDNPLNKIISENTNTLGEIDEPAVIQQGIMEFNEDYINFILVALGTGYLHSAPFLGNPTLELSLTEETWNSEIIDGMPNSELEVVEGEDLRISMGKETAVNAILSDDVEQFMKDAVVRKDITIELVAGKPELFAKGYLDMYNELTGEEITSDDDLILDEEINLDDLPEDIPEEFPEGFPAENLE